MSARITTCLHCNHTAAYEAFEQNAVGFSRMKCPKCGSTSRFATDAVAEQTNDQPASDVTAASAAASDAQPEESDMATEAPTRKPRASAKPEQGTLIDTDDPAHKPLIKAIKAYRKEQAERSEVLGESKERVKVRRDKCIELMRQLGLKSFAHGDFEAELSEGEVKLVVKSRSGDADADDDDDAEE